MTRREREHTSQTLEPTCTGSPGESLAPLQLEEAILRVQRVSESERAKWDSRAHSLPVSRSLRTAFFPAMISTPSPSHTGCFLFVCLRQKHCRDARESAYFSPRTTLELTV